MLKKTFISLSLITIVMFSGCSSYPDEFVEYKLGKKLGKENLVISSFSVEDEEEIEFMGRKGTSLVVNVTYVAPKDKVICKYDYKYKKTYFKPAGIYKDLQDIVASEKECLEMESAINQKVITELKEVRTITFAKQDIIKWEAKQ